MKIIISESQANKLKKGLLELIKLYGFESVVETQGISKLKLAKMVGIPINSGTTVFEKGEVAVGQLLKDLVAIDDVYNECVLDWDSMSGSIIWTCSFDDGNQIINTTTYATPYWNNEGLTPIETDMFEVIKDGEKDEYGGMSYDYWGGVHSPVKFENVDELINWFETEYKVETYYTIKRHLEYFVDWVS